MKFLIIFFAFFTAAAHVQAYVAFDRSAVEYSPYSYSYPLELRYNGPDHLGYSTYHNQDIIGQYNFGYNTINNKRTEARDAFGNVVGSYSYVDADGKIQTVNYRADEDGFSVAGTTIPVSSSAIENLKPVEEAEDVMLARESHFKAYNDFISDNYDLPVAPELPAAMDLPESVTDEPLIALAKKQHNEYREGLKKEYETLERLSYPIVPMVREADIIPSPIVTNNAIITPTFLPELKSIFSIRKKSISPIVTEGKIHEPFISPAYSPLPVVSSSHIAQALRSISPIVADGEVHEPLITPAYSPLPVVSSSHIVPTLKSFSPIVAEGKIHEPLTTSAYSPLPVISSSYIAPTLKSVSPVIAEGKIHEPLITPEYFP